MVRGQEIARRESCVCLRNYVFLFVERMVYSSVKNNIRIAVAWSGFERVGRFHPVIGHKGP
jgi:hypothetical protein